jgi:hypothetical protein
MAHKDWRRRITVAKTVFGVLQRDEPITIGHNDASSDVSGNGS